MRLDTFTALFSAPIMLAIAGCLATFVAAWSDRRDSRTLRDRP